MDLLFARKKIVLFTLYTMGNKESGSADKEFVATYTSVDSTNDCNYFNNYRFTIIITMLVSRILTCMSFCTSGGISHSTRAM